MDASIGSEEVAAVRVDGFSFTYPTATEPSLSDLSFRIGRGDVLGVVGPVEAGKTTLAMALASFAPQNTGGTTAGDLSVAGRDPRNADDNAVAMVFEDYSTQLTQVSAIDEVVAPLVNRGLPRTEAVPKARDLLDRVRLADAEEKFTWDLSGGQQQRLAIAAALAIDPEMLIFDTATDMLDPEGREDVANLIASMAGDTTLVVTANDPDGLVGIADHLLVLEGGEQTAFGPADELLRDYGLLQDVGVGAPLCLEVAQRLGLEASPLTPGELVERLGGPRDETAPRRAVVNGGVAADPPSAKTLEVGDATYEYADGTVAVNDVDLDVHGGEVHAVVGGNGAGKSTFGRLLVGLLNPDAGYVRVRGTETDEVTASGLATSIGIALQNPDKQLSEQTVEAELRFPLERRQYRRTGWFSKERQYDDEYIGERVEEVCDTLGIGESDLDLDPMFLPRGSQRLVSIGLAMVTDPDAVVLDEPTAGLDAETRMRVTSTIERLKENGRSIVLIDHDMDFVCEVADQVTVLSDGEAVVQGPTEEVFAHENWDWLAEHHIRPPRVAQLGRGLGLDVLTVDQLVEELAPTLEETV